MSQLYRLLEQHLEVFITDTARFSTQIGQSYIIFLLTVSCRNSKLRPNFSTPDFRIVNTHSSVCVCMCFAILKFAQKSTTSVCHSQQLLWPVKCTQKRKISSNTTQGESRDAPLLLTSQPVDTHTHGSRTKSFDEPVRPRRVQRSKIRKKQYIFCFPS